jgi:hypothetical protein
MKNTTWWIFERSAVLKTWGNHNSKTSQNSLRELVESSAVDGNGVNIIIPKHDKFPQGIG